MVLDISTQDNVIQTECKRCGTCCRRGGPTLHRDDRHLVVSGVLTPSMLVTLRRGEPALDPAENRLMLLPSELIKISGVNGLNECRFFQARRNSCAIYEHRPLECRALKCWDTAEITALFLRDLLLRTELMPSGSMVWKLVEKYEAAFPVRLIRDLCLASSSGSKEAAIELEELRDHDSSFRQQASEFLGLPSEDMNFFLGRPVSEVTELFFLSQPDDLAKK